MTERRPPTDPASSNDPERVRLREARDANVRWRRWGPYLSSRQWGTVREDYSAGGDAWDFFPYDQARSRAYRWGEDGLLGISDAQGDLCFSFALWNEADPMLKERLYGLSGPEGNHGEDVKELYYHLDATPTGSYLKALYKYPQAAFPYADLVAINARRGRDAPEYELLDTGIFDDDRYFDVTIEYAKQTPEEIVIRLTGVNRGLHAAPLHVLPTLWFRNTWSWGRDERRPELRAHGEAPPVGTDRHVRATHHRLGTYWLSLPGEPALLFTENETNAERLWGQPNASPFVKDGIDITVVSGQTGRVNPAGIGTKVAGHYTWTLAPGEERSVVLRLSRSEAPRPVDERAAGALFTDRIGEADAFYAQISAPGAPLEPTNVMRQAFAGLIWTKQTFIFDVEQWLAGDPIGPAPPAERKQGRNADWPHFKAHDVLSMPDDWEYPWFAAWDSAFHAIPFAVIDPEFAKKQLILLTREWYMHGNGQLPAYEWNFGDVNPPVHAWAALRVYQIDRRVSGVADRAFLERVFHKLLINFTWWVNRKDAHGHGVFQGGFLGLDNIGVFDRSAALPGGGHLGQADGTAWMGMYSLNLLAIALELGREEPVYEDIATKFFEHFLQIAAALNNLGGRSVSLWDEEDEFYYDVLHLPDDSVIPLKVRSLVGLMPLLAVTTIEPDLLERMPDFRRRMDWVLKNQPELAALVSRWSDPGMGERRLLSLVRGHRMKRLLARMLDPSEFLSPHGIRALSRYHAEHPYMLEFEGMKYEVRYEPGESSTALFGGNSNWRGPIWFPINFLLVEALQRFHHYYGDEFTVEYPTGSGTRATLDAVADGISRRLTHIFLPDDQGRRPVHGAQDRYATDPAWRDLVLFHEYFDGDTGRGVGASHQTGWTALVAKLLEQTDGR